MFSAAGYIFVIVLCIICRICDLKINYFTFICGIMLEIFFVKIGFVGINISEIFYEVQWNFRR